MPAHTRSLRGAFGRKYRLKWYHYIPVYIELSLFSIADEMQVGTHPTYDISTEFKICLKVLLAIKQQKLIEMNTFCIYIDGFCEVSSW